jgi:hypothetical protein
VRKKQKENLEIPDSIFLGLGTDSTGKGRLRTGENCLNDLDRAVKE